MRTLEGLGAAAVLTAALEPVLTQAAGVGGRHVSPQSLALDLVHPLADLSAGAELTIEAWVERATRTLVFAAAEARTGEGRLAAAMSGVFRVSETGD